MIRYLIFIMFFSACTSTLVVPSDTYVGSRAYNKIYVSGISIDALIKFKSAAQSFKFIPLEEKTQMIEEHSALCINVIKTELESPTSKKFLTYFTFSIYPYTIYRVYQATIYECNSSEKVLRKISYKIEHNYGLLMIFNYSPAFNEDEKGAIGLLNLLR